jgi:hypothetical protein
MMNRAVQTQAARPPGRISERAWMMRAKCAISLHLLIYWRDTLLCRSPAATVRNDAEIFPIHRITTWRVATRPGMFDAGAPSKLMILLLHI